jgi:hypothetical protein
VANELALCVKLYDIAPRYLPPETPQNIINFALVAFPPIVLGWLLAYVLVYLVRWIRTGLRELIEDLWPELVHKLPPRNSPGLIMQAKPENKISGPKNVGFADVEPHRNDFSRAVFIDENQHEQRGTDESNQDRRRLSRAGARGGR